jgi:murein DD-endopeptidase MepM/ murein hydrolase activator NlpD
MLWARIAKLRSDSHVLFSRNSLMFRKKQVYYYDTDTCTFQPRKLTLHFVAKKASFYVLFALIATIGAKFYFDHYMVQLKSSDLRLQNEGLLGRLNEINGKIDLFESNLGAIYDKENALYLPIVGENRISQSRWKSGTGGEANFDKSINNAAYKTSLRINSMRSRVILLNNSLEKVQSRSDAIDTELANMPSILPVNGTLISGFGYRNHPVSGFTKFHQGLDFACPVGTPIYASGNGKIDIAETGENGYGICLNVDHQNGYRTKYGHLSKIIVRHGQEVKRGQLLAYSGNTGLSTGPHLHYEVAFKGVKTDPIDFIYMDLPPTEYIRMNLDKNSITKEAVKEKLVAPSMD